MALSPKAVEAWFNENVIIVKDQYTTKDDIWQSFCVKFPDVSSAEKGLFFSLFGRVVQKIDNVFVVKKFSKNMGYQGVALKNNLMQLNKHTVMDWALSKLAPGTANDIMTKDAVVDCFKVHYRGVLSERDRQRFLSLFGQTVVGKGPFSSVTAKKKIVVGLKVKESTTESTFESGSENKSSTQGEEDTAGPFVADVSNCDGYIEHHSMDQNLLNYKKYSNERAQNVDDAVTNSETDSNVQETITDVIEGDVNAVMSDDANACKKEVPDLFTQEIQIFGEEVDSDSEISEEEDECFAATLDDENYS